jgi:uncharacterized RDD family membrane protein YckC
MFGRTQADHGLLPEPVRAFMSRVVATQIDAVLVCLTSIVTFVVLGIAIALSRGPRAMASFNALWDALWWFFFLAVGWLYWAGCESSAAQATLGKRVMRIQVTDLEGDRISFGRATLRYFAKILSVLPFNLGFLMIAFTRRHQGLHDMLAGTVVVKRPR